MMVKRIVFMKEMLGEKKESCGLYLFCEVRDVVECERIDQILRGNLLNG